MIEAAAFRHVIRGLDAPLDALGHALLAFAKQMPDTDLPAAFVDEVRRRATPLASVIVRSSATIEDTDAGAAAGVLSSVKFVKAEDALAAVRHVWASALTPLAASYARTRGADLAVGVIVQRQVRGELSTIYTRPPGRPTDDEMLVQRRAALAVVPRDLDSLAIRAEAAIGAVHGADVELIDEHVVQARPIVHPVATQPRTPPPPALLGRLMADDRPWTWDIAHNPDPLSPAQTEIIDAITRADVAPWSFAVVAGYLYTASRARREVTVVARSRLMEDFELLERQLRPLVVDEDLPIAEALDRYVQAYAIWANEMSPYVTAVKRFMTSTGGPRPSSVEAMLAAVAHRDDASARAMLGIMSPAWDIAVPTYGEEPSRLAIAIERARELPAPKDGPIDLAGELAERDDLWFARMQWMVRRALLRRGDELGIDREDIGWLPFSDLERGIDADDARRKASGARAAARRAAQWEMPVVVGRTDTAPAVREPLSGIGTGPRATGRVVRFASLASAVVVGAGDVVVTRAVTPALAVMVIGCAALVSETGGLLDHGAALARELGIPCVVGCADAWSQLADGEIVTVDGNSGTVTRI